MINPFKKMIRGLREPIEIPEMVEQRLENTLQSLPSKVERDTAKVPLDKGVNRRRIVKVAAAAMGAVLIVGTTAYAAANHTSLLAFMTGASSTTKENAKQMLQENISQERTVASGNRDWVWDNCWDDTLRESDWISVDITGGICDKNMVMVQAEIKAKDSEHYFPCVGTFIHDDGFLIDSTGRINGLNDEGKTVQEFAGELKRTPIDVFPSLMDEKGLTPMGAYHDDYMLRDDGTLVLTMRFCNISEEEEFSYLLSVKAVPPDNSEDYEHAPAVTKRFTLKNNLDYQTVHYVPVDENIKGNKFKTKIKGTDCIITEVCVEKAAISERVSIHYKYIGKDVYEKNWNKMADSDIWFTVCDSSGNELDSCGFEEGMDDWGLHKISGYWGWSDSKYADRKYFPLNQLPDRIIIKTRACAESDSENEELIFGSIQLKRVEP